MELWGYGAIGLWGYGVIPGGGLRRMGGCERQTPNPIMEHAHMPISSPMHYRTLIASAAAVAASILLVACGSDPAGPEEPETLALPTEWAFETGADGWTLGSASTGGSATHNSAEGSLILAGSGDPGAANAWMSRTVTLPVPDAGYAWIDAYVAADCIDGQSGDTYLRITAESEEQGLVTVRDWTSIDETYQNVGGSLEAFEGQTVTITIEMDDEGEQQDPADPEEACVDMVSIFLD